MGPQYGSVVSSEGRVEQDTCEISTPQLYISEAEDYSSSSATGDTSSFDKLL